MSRIVFLPRVTQSTHSGTTPILNSQEWRDEEIFLNELFRLKNTNKFFIYHEVDEVIRIDPIGISLDSMGIYSVINSAPPPNGVGLNIWDRSIDFSGIFNANGNVDSAFRLTVMNDQHIYSITLGQLLDKLPHAYKIENDTIINNTDYYATTLLNGFARFASYEEINNNSNVVAVTPSDVSAIVDKKFETLPYSSTSEFGVVKLANASDISEDSVNTAITPADTIALASNAVDQIPYANTADRGLLRFATPQEISIPSTDCAITLVNASEMINARLSEFDVNALPDADTDTEGIMELATTEETVGAINITAAVTTTGAIVVIDSKLEEIIYANTSEKGVVKFANNTEISNNDANTVISPANLDALADPYINAIPYATIAIQGRGVSRFATLIELESDSNNLLINPANMNSLIVSRVNAVNIENFVASTDEYGSTRLATSTEVEDKSSILAAVTPADINKMVTEKLLVEGFNIDANRLFKVENPVILSGEVEHAESFIDGNERINITTKFPASSSLPSPTQGEILRVITDTKFAKVTSDDIALKADDYIYDDITNELRVKWGRHSTFTKIDLTQPPFTLLGSSALNGLIFEKGYEDDILTEGTDEQVKFCSGRTFKLRVITRLGIGLLFAPVISSGSDVSLNGNPIFVLHPGIDSGEFDLEFTSIDGINVEYLGKRQVLANQVILRGFNTPVSNSDIWTWGTTPPQKITNPNKKWISISCGYNFSLAIDTSGHLWAWGTNYAYGQLGIGNKESVSVPTIVNETTVWKYIACGVNHSLAIDSVGRIWTWGYNVYYTLGLGDTNEWLIPEKIVSITTDGTTPISLLPSSGIFWKKVDGGEYHSVALDSDGGLWAWGYNVGGEVGIGSSTASRRYPQKLTRVINPLTTSTSMTIPSTLVWNNIVCGTRHTLALDTTGAIWAWGYNTSKQTGLGSNTKYNYPTKIKKIITSAGIIVDISTVGIKWKNIASKGIHSLAVDFDGNIWAWGNNGTGRLGLGDTTERMHPQMLTSVTLDGTTPVSIASQGIKWKSVAAGNDFSMALDTNNDIWVWGNNASGKLGLGDSNTRYYPQKLNSEIDWKTMSCGATNILALSR